MEYLNENDQLVWSEDETIRLFLVSIHIEIHFKLNFLLFEEMKTVTLI